MKEATLGTLAAVTALLQVALAGCTFLGGASLACPLGSGPADASSSVSADKVSWTFCDRSGSQFTWSFPVAAYQAYATGAHPRTPIVLKDDSGSEFTVNDVRPYVRSAFFMPVIGDLTQGRTDRQFVQEAFNVKRDFISYAASSLDDRRLYQYPAETMTLRTGICGDTTILLASLLEAGNEQAGYGMKISVIYVDFDTTTNSIVAPPTTVNHVLVHVTFRDGTNEFVETTSSEFYAWTGQVTGWDFPIPTGV
ncbi:MAG: hypothetical protein ACYDBQ_05220 [Thermoplasmatota archaeon]